MACQTGQKDIGTIPSLTSMAKGHTEQMRGADAGKASIASTISRSRRASAFNTW